MDENTSGGKAFLNWLKDQAKAAMVEPPETINQWEERRLELKESLDRSFGGDEPISGPPKVKVCGELMGDGFKIEKLLIETRPHVEMTANLYIPEGIDEEKKAPAILGVHGHWPQGKIAERIQYRCIGLAKLGYVVLMVDAFGSGERSIHIKENNYHGGLVGASLWPVGARLLGLQVYDNMRAIDYLITRPEVDPQRIGCTGASGGGNQTMYVTAFDERIKVGVSVVSVGSFYSYIGSSNCVCETLIDGLTYAEEWEVIGLIAPRPFLVINATQDSFCFSVGEASKTLARAQKIYELYGQKEALSHLAIEGTHGYHQPMREAVYGWFQKWLKGAPTCEPISEPKVVTFPEEELLCFPGFVRGENFTTIPAYVSRLGKAVERESPGTFVEWRATSKELKKRLRSVLKLKYESGDVEYAVQEDGDHIRIDLELEGGLRTKLTLQRGEEQRICNVILAPKGAEAAIDSEEWRSAILTGEDVATFDLRGIGTLAWSGAALRDIPDHNSARAALWIGRTLAGMWVEDIKRALTAIEDLRGTESFRLVGIESMAPVALFAAGIDPAITSVVAKKPLATYSVGGTFSGQFMGIMVPDLLTSVGDMPHIAALMAPGELKIQGAVDSEGRSCELAEIEKYFSFTRSIYELMGKGKSLEISVE